MILNSILEAVGNTPLVRLNRLKEGIAGTILVKVEYFNPGNSVKDRVAMRMIADAERDGRIKSGGTIIEGTSGNTGMGLALTAAVKGYRCIFTMSDKQSQEKVNVLKALGAQVVICPSAVPDDHPDSFHSVAERLHHEIPNSVHLNQYDNPSNLAAHYEGTGPEIWQQPDGKITHYVATVGTGGSMTGTAKYLKEQNSGVVTLGVDPYGSMFKTLKETGKIEAREMFPYLVEGFGGSTLPQNVDMTYIDTIIKVTDQQGALMARRLAREEGLFVGWSCGASVHVALEYAKKNLKKDDVMVVLLADHGTRYLNKIYHDEWMKKLGFMDESPFTTGDILKKRSANGKSLATLQTVGGKTSIKAALGLMVEHGIGRLPVMDGRVAIGCVTKRVLTDRLMANTVSSSECLDRVMDAPIPVVSHSLSIGALRAKLDNPSGAVLVSDWDSALHIITQNDVSQLIAQ